MRPLALLLLLAAGSLPVAAQTPTDSTKTPPPAPAPTTGYGAWFGSVPDMDANEAGILLGGVTAGSPAAKAGLKKGDLIVAMGGEPVLDLREMVEVLRSHRAGDEIEVVYWRGNEEKKVKVTLGARPGG
ncbi:MAG TPA: PDZ domain-containing protein [Gemmatimonadales bacterium]|nr:PDZ domain-containing protein [Gemmatimonadota bacterium]HPF61389.1 PDZ domain-containing protein [Gemmatimonadales bacterium]HRX17641.1 PDZ domain-containing protein [Gemmatimonadales bacterium]